MRAGVIRIKKTAMRLKGCDVTQGLIGGVMSTGTAVSGGAGAGRRRKFTGSHGYSCCGRHGNIHVAHAVLLCR
jgi:hypothetical protein